MVSTDNFRTVVTILGNMTGISLFISPILTFCRIWKKRSVELFSPAPYLAALPTLMLWALYGLPVVQPHRTLLLIISACGCLIELFYVLLFLTYSEGRQRLRVFVILLMEIAFIGIVAVLVLTLSQTHEQRSLIVGSLSAVFGCIMYASPLTVMKLVIKTRSVEYMPFYLSLTSFVNGVCWTLYALLRFDLFVMIPNGTGALLGFAQLVLYATFYKSTKKEIEARNKDKEEGLIHMTVNGDPNKTIISP